MLCLHRLSLYVVRYFGDDRKITQITKSNIWPSIDNMQCRSRTHINKLCFEMCQFRNKWHINKLNQNSLQFVALYLDETMHNFHGIL